MFRECGAPPPTHGGHHLSQLVKLRQAFRQVRSPGPTAAVIHEFLSSGSKDGCIKIWDGVSNRCIATFLQAHDGSPISSVTFSRNGKYVLSSGMVRKGTETILTMMIYPMAILYWYYCRMPGQDSLVKLWELSTSRCLIAYTGAGSTGKQVTSAECARYIPPTSAPRTLLSMAPDPVHHQEHQAQAVFNQTEDYVMFPDEATTSLCVWDSRSLSVS